MIQELLGGGATSLLGGDHRKISNNINSCGGILQGPITSTTSTPTTTTTITTTNTTTTTSSATTTNATTPNTSEQQNLRCPRCDSSNTKFCYYNNYNLTQPRHFCKTCRRYWTKGGALRNVPIGGGCRKNKSTTSSSVTSAKVGGATGMKVKSGSTDIIKSSTLGFDHEQSPNPILWASPHNSHLLALLRATTQNPNPNPNSVIIKEEGSLLASTINGSSHLNSSNSSSSEAAVMALNARPNIISSSDLPIGLCSTSWRNLNLNNHHHHHQQQVQYHHQQQQQQQQQQQYHHGLLSTSEVQNSSSSGLHELYQRLRSASSNYQTDHHHHHHQSPTFLTNNSFCSSSPSTALDPSPISGADHLAGYWNPAFSSSAAWSNLSTTNGAFP